ncbi:hypothetical protein ID852_03535 [Xenorhabdus sp. 42]|uniref:Uncharacterized protein n=1 Tax=Xenorhabdus szentirmaii TaxID=290112 RepID=A0AAW3YRV2_9GAMM|nr:MULTISPECIES: hypothetical protein [unclassified Xenorhabdus]MBD2779698.1 hypothetical protein [Xenorhabdus sp. 38]MBD2800321.1 hypothetical protein [Xenorhabdus sp. M]MBD2819779.1 hypothetical protein [Xenorhabdus sp. 42]MBD2826273.1 hypothetical protein [Xenorhabdus sp. 5]
MTYDEQTLLMFKGLIAELPEESRKSYEQCIKVVRQLLTDYPNGEALIAIGIIGAEQQMQGRWGQG